MTGSEPATERQTIIAYATSRSKSVEIVPAKRAREWMLATDRSFANRCLPLLVANESGWWLINRDGFTATWDGRTTQDGITIEWDDPEAEHKAGPTSRFGHGVLTWPVFYLFRTPPGVNLLVRGPANWPKDGVCALEGMVETDWAEVTFTMNWRFTRPDAPVRFEPGEPFCQVVPQGRGELECYEPERRSIREEPELYERMKSWADDRRQNDVRAWIMEQTNTPGFEPDWDMRYRGGRYVTGDNAPPDHQIRRSLKPFAAP
jgi:Family of unknown function (DUF6065)